MTNYSRKRNLSEKRRKKTRMRGGGGKKKEEIEGENKRDAFDYLNIKIES